MEVVTCGLVLPYGRICHTTSTGVVGVPWRTSFESKQATFPALPIAAETRRPTIFHHLVVSSTAS
eukprot:scaffold132261_cov38-Prasinocladus_malaysianus.AAC.1